MIEEQTEFEERIENANSKEEYVSILIDILNEPEEPREENYWGNFVRASDSYEVIRQQAESCGISMDEARKKIESDLESIWIDDCKKKPRMLNYLFKECVEDLQDLVH